MTNDCLHSELTRLSATLWECAERDCMFAIRLPQPATSSDREVPGSQVEPKAEPYTFAALFGECPKLPEDRVSLGLWRDWPPRQAGPVKCGACGARRAEGTKRCTNCGTDI